MLFVVTCIDQPNRLTLRRENRPAHSAYLDLLGEREKLGGAQLRLDSQGPIGSMIVFENESETDIAALPANGPDARAGIVASVDVISCSHGADTPLAWG